MMIEDDKLTPEQADAVIAQWVAKSKEVEWTWEEKNVPMARGTWQMSGRVLGYRITEQDWNRIKRSRVLRDAVTRCTGMKFVDDDEG